MAHFLSYKGVLPKVEDNAFIAGNAVLSGNIEIGAGSGVWYNCVLRGDVAAIKVGKMTNIQDGTVVHGTRPHHKQNKTGSEGGATTIGDNVTIGHACIIHACTIQDNAFIGMGSTLMDLSTVERHGMLAAGSVLTPGKVVKSGELWAGVPAKLFRKMTQEEIDYIQTSAENYHELAMEYIDSERQGAKGSGF